jgi:hypothetical protein
MHNELLRLSVVIRRAVETPDAPFAFVFVRKALLGIFAAKAVSG